MTSHDPAEVLLNYGSLRSVVTVGVNTEVDPCEYHMGTSVDLGVDTETTQVMTRP